jgi:hypothetical protein
MILNAKNIFFFKAMILLTDFQKISFENVNYKYEKTLIKQDSLII